MGIALHLGWGVMCCLLQLERLSLVDMVHLWAKGVRRCGEQLLYTSFGRFGKREIDWLSMMMCFRSKDSNTFFVFSLWAEVKLFIADCPLTFVNFIDWLGSS